VDTAGAAQLKEWSTNPRDWAELQEAQMRGVYDAVVRSVVRPGTRLLDAGCGSGMFCRLAADAGADVAGIDASSSVLEIARERTPEAEFVHGDMESLPWGDATFDLVTGIAAFTFTANPVLALREAARVVKPDGRVVIATWGPADECEAAVIFAVLAQLLPATAHESPGPFRLSLRGALDELVADAGLATERYEDVPCAWTYPSLDVALRALFSGGSARAAVAHAGEDATRDALVRALERHADGSGGYRLENVFRFLVARP